MSFGAQVRTMTKKAQVQTHAQAKKLTTEVLRSIIMSTPVLTGRLRGGWNTSFGSANLNITGRIDPTGQATLAEMMAVVSSLPDSSWELYMSNAVPYSTYIEYEGRSTQAPAGMVRINMTRVASLVATVLRG